MIHGQCPHLDSQPKQKQMTRTHFMITFESQKHIIIGAFWLYTYIPDILPVFLSLVKWEGGGGGVCGILVVLSLQLCVSTTLI